MNNRDRLLTVDKVMEIIPLGKTSVTAIVKSIPHVTMGRKLMVYESEVQKWVRAHTIDPSAPTESRKKPRLPRGCGLTADGLVPTRAQLRAMEKAVIARADGSSSPSTTTEPQRFTFTTTRTRPSGRPTS